MAARPDSAILRLGAMCLVVLALTMAASFNLQKFPGFKGTDFHAQLRDASGLHRGNMVQVAGVRVGRISDIRITGDTVTVDFDAKGVELGKDTRASVEVLNLLGEKYLQLIPAGTGEMEDGDTIPVSRTHAGYDIVSTLSELTTRTEDIDTPRLGRALTQLGDTLNAASPHVQATFSGISRLSRTIASRDQSIEQLLHRADRVTQLLSQRRGDLVTLMKQGQLVFQELHRRRAAVHTLLVNTERMADALHGIAAENQRQIRPALRELDIALRFLRARKRQLDATLKNVGPYASILINVVGTGPWFDAYVPNFVGIAGGEFEPGKRKR